MPEGFLWQCRKNGLLQEGLMTMATIIVTTQYNFRQRRLYTGESIQGALLEIEGKKKVIAHVRPSPILARLALVLMS